MTYFIRSVPGKPFLFAFLSVAAVAFLALGCEDSSMVAPSEESDAAESTARAKSAHGGTASAQVLRARLQPVGSTGVAGEVTVRMKGDELDVLVNARGLEASVEHAQHFHQNATCASFGPVVISLDDDIANAPGDATNADVGDDLFPVATPGGTVHYRESTSKSALAAALGMNPDLANRTVVVHAEGTPIGPPAACGELNPVGR